MRELEKALGVSLLRSEGRNLVLTDAGVAAMHGPIRSLRWASNLPHRVRKPPAKPHLRLNLGISDGIANWPCTGC